MNALAKSDSSLSCLCCIKIIKVCKIEINANSLAWSYLSWSWFCCIDGIKNCWLIYHMFFFIFIYIFGKNVLSSKGNHFIKCISTICVWCMDGISAISLFFINTIQNVGTKIWTIRSMISCLFCITIIEICNDEIDSDSLAWSNSW